MKGKKQGVFVGLIRLDKLAFFQIGLQRVGHFLRKIQNDLISALARDQNRIQMKIQIVDVYSDAFADAHTRSEEKHQDRHVPGLGQLVELLLTLRQGCTVRGNAQQPIYFFVDQI